MNIDMSACRDGFDQTRIDALLHQIELSTKHQTSNFGLGLIMVNTLIYYYKDNLVEYIFTERYSLISITNIC